MLNCLHIYLQDLSQKLGDDKGLSEHLQLPIQRINDYQLLLKVCIIDLYSLDQKTKSLN